MRRTQFNPVFLSRISSRKVKFHHKATSTKCILEKFHFSRGRFCACVMNFSSNDGLFILVCLLGQLICTIADRGLGQFQSTLSWIPLATFFLAEVLGKVGFQGIVAHWIGSEFSLLRIFAVVLAIPLINAYLRGLMEFHLITWIGVIIFLSGATILTLFGRS